MSVPQPPQPAKLVIGLIIGEQSGFDPLAASLEDRFGEIDLRSPWFPFVWTRYYDKEMGAALVRRFLSFRRLIRQEDLAAVKLETNGMEQALAVSGRRTVNIDPGYLLRERFVLATGKNFAHRIYIGCRLYADLTLVYREGRYRTLPWTYPDYADPAVRQFLQNVRDRYIADLKAGPAEEPNRYPDAAASGTNETGKQQ